MIEYKNATRFLLFFSHLKTDYDTDLTMIEDRFSGEGMASDGSVE
jgi:hypothetical protein